MSDLTAFRNHARLMFTAEHKVECAWPSRLAVEAHNRQEATFERLRGEPEGTRTRVVHCPGCVTADERELWARLAAEVDDYLAPQPDLFGDLTTEPIQQGSGCESCAGHGLLNGLETCPDCTESATEGEPA